MGDVAGPNWHHTTPPKITIGVFLDGLWSCVLTIGIECDVIVGEQDDGRFGFSDSLVRAWLVADGRFGDVTAQVNGR